jgi:hypothetical protein
MYTLIEPIQPFGATSEFITTCNEDVKQWLIDSGRCDESNFKKVSNEKTKKKNEK